MACSPSCRLCNRLIISESVSVVTVSGVDTLVVDLPSQAYNDNQKYCIVIAQTIPTTATIYMPVAFSIGGDTTTVYPFVRCDCSQITACGIRTRTRYSTVVSTNAIGGVFKSLGGISCTPNNDLISIPAPAPATTNAGGENTSNNTRNATTAQITPLNATLKAETATKVATKSTTNKGGNTK